MNIPFISSGEAVPLGLSKHASGHRLKFPIWARNRSGFDPVQDEFARGRWVLEACIRTELSGIAVHWGWRLAGRRVEAAA